MEVLERLFNVAMLVATIRTTTPILLVALGGSFTTKAGIFNIGLEGQMLVGAFFAVIGSIYTGSAWLGVLCGVAAAMTFALIFVILVVSFRANEVVVGLALNILAGGMTISLMKAIFGTRGSIVGQGIVGLRPVRIPGASELGVYGQLISGFTPLVYVAFALVLLLLLFYGHTRLGLHIRVVGEAPEAAEAQGISITRVRYIASLLCGLLAGLAGAHLSLGYITMFTENMSSGRGFMAVAVLDFLQWRSAESVRRLPAVRLLRRDRPATADLRLPVLSGAGGALPGGADRPVRPVLPLAPAHHPRDPRIHAKAATGREPTRTTLRG